MSSYGRLRLSTTMWAAPASWVTYGCPSVYAVYGVQGVCWRDGRKLMGDDAKLTQVRPMTARMDLYAK